MSKIPYYKISTSLKKTNQYKEKKGFWYNRKRTQLVLGVLGVYLVASGVLGFLMFGNRNPDIAKASESANVSSSIRFVSEKEFTVGDNVEVILTLQNTSVTEPINDLSVDFLSTKDSIKWNKLSVRSSTEQVTASNQIGSFNIPSLGLGERAEYLLTGTYQNSDLDFLIILGKLRYTNDIGIQNIDTNRIYTNLKPDQDEKSRPFLLSVNSPRVAQGENLILTLDGRSPEIPLTSKDKGKIYISRKTSGEVVATFDCLPEEKGQCQFTSNNIGVGEYSAIFLNEEIGTASTIAAFSVGGTPEANALVPSEQANLVLPFGSKSINGLIPVIAQRVITQNQSPDKSPECVFDVIKDGKVLVSNKSKIEDDRSCRTEFTFEQFKASGIYKIKLNNSNLENEVSVVEKAPGLLTIQNLTPNTQKNQNIQIKVENINDAQNQAVNDDEVTISIYQKQNGSVEKINTINGDKIKILAGKLEATLEGKYFSNGGTYLVYFESKSGKTSDFLTVNFSDSNVAFSNSGILIEDYSKLKVGSDFGLKIQGITNKDGGLVSGGSCTANLYSVSSGALPVAIEGKITGGICEVLVGKGKVNKSGPLLISFNSNNSAISLNQSKQLQIAPGDPADFGGINLEYEPALSDFANSAIIGPVVDEYSNPTTSFGNTLFIKKENGEIIKEIPEVSITNGFAKILLPSSTITGNKIILSLTDKAGVEKLTKEYSIKTTQTNLSFPNIADSIKNDSPIDISAKNVTEDSTDFCTVKFTRSAKEFIEEKIPYQKDEDVCNLSWNLNRFRDTNQALIEVSVSNQKYNKIINLKPSEPANLFSIHSQARFNSQKELQISLASSPIVDIQGMPVNSGQTTWQYNGKIEKADIVDGFAKLDLTASQLESRDIRTKLDERYLDLDIDVEASITSISQTNNVSVYLGQFDLSNQKGDFAIKNASNYISSQYPKIFRFLGDSCNAFVLSNSNSTSTNLKSYKKGKECLVEVIAPVGKNTLIFEDNGFILGKLDFVVGNETQEVDWCGDQDCELIQVKAPINSKIEAIIYDGENQYKFEAGELENIIKVKQNGLNPLKEYLVEIRYKDASGNSVSHFNTILGENLISK